MDNLLLRTATPADEAFLQELFFDVRGDEFLMAGLSAEQLKPLLTMQYMAQKQSYGGRFPGAEHSIIELAGDRVGRLLIDRHENNIHLIDIAILRASRGRGIGGFILEKLKAESETVSLMVFTTNHGAIRLYRRQGFTIVNDTGSYLEMEWKNAR